MQYAIAAGLLAFLAVLVAILGAWGPSVVQRPYRSSRAASAAPGTGDRLRAPSWRSTDVQPAHRPQRNHRVRGINPLS